MRRNIIAILAPFLALGCATAGQDRPYWSSRSSGPPAYGDSQGFGIGYHCSLDQREYAYINECGELIPSIWDQIPGRG